MQGKILNDPINLDRKAQAIARNSQNCSTTTLLGNWNRATQPPSSLLPGEILILSAGSVLFQQYSNVGLGSSLRGEPGLTTFRSQGCPWKIISGLRQSDTHRGGTRASSTWQKKPSNCSKSVKKLTLLLAVSQKISAKLFRSWLLGRPRLLCC